MTYASSIHLPISYFPKVYLTDYISGSRTQRFQHCCYQSMLVGIIPSHCYPPPILTTNYSEHIHTLSVFRGLLPKDCTINLIYDFFCLSPISLLFSTGSVVHAGPWPPSGSISRCLYPMALFCSL